jgi:hypothetical protein
MVTVCFLKLYIIYIYILVRPVKTSLFAVQSSLCEVFNLRRLVSVSVLASQGQKTGPDRTFEHYLERKKTNIIAGS